MKYNLILKQKEDEQLYKRVYDLLNQRIKLKIDEKLGLRGMSFSEVKIKLNSERDKYSTVLAELEELEKEKDLVKKELNIIKDFFDKIDRDISQMKEKEKKVFKAKYLYGLSNLDIASQLNCSEKTIQRLLKEIEKNIKMSS